MCAIARVQVDQNGADLGGGKLRQHPFRAVGGPHPDPLALFDAQSHQPPRESFHLLAKLTPGKPLAGVPHHKRKTVGKAFGGAIKRLADAKVQQLGTIWDLLNS